VIAVNDRIRHAVEKQPQNFLAMLERSTAKIQPVEVKQIERIEGNAVRAELLQLTFQRAEVRRASAPASRRRSFAPGAAPDRCSHERIGALIC
jgi:hypothetical protein